MIMHTYQSPQVSSGLETHKNKPEMRLLNNRIFWNLTKNLSTKEQPTVFGKLHYSSKSSDNNVASQNFLPKQNLLKYHVLPLDETLDRFLGTVKPLLTAEEYDRQVELTNDFKNKDGKKLQAMLQKVGEKESNWLAGRWQKTAYLQYRDPVTVYVSPGMTFPPQKFKNYEDFLCYTAKVIYGLGEFKNIVDSGRIPIVKMGNNELDNSQFGKVFGTCRIPRPITDEIVYNPNSKHVVIIYKNHFYKLNIYDSANQLVAVPTLAKHLAKIVESEHTFGIPYGILTTDSRDNWAHAYEALVKIPKNCDALHIIQTSLFNVSLDQCVSFEPAEQANQLILSLIHGEGSTVNSANRWMDKTIQLVVNPNGNVGFTYEHSPAEGQPIAMMMDFVVNKMSEDNKFGENGSTNECSKPEKICFGEPNPCIDLLLLYSMKNIDKLVNDLQMHVLKFECFGKGFIKTARLGPDSFVQMALQLTFYKIHKVPAAQYESAHLRIFTEGRTETIRSCSIESLAFCKAMTDPNVGNADRSRLLREAIAGHQKYTKLALQGRGVDRHLLGLKLMALENNLPVPKFYSSLGFIKSQQFRMSTSQVATLNEAFMGYGPSTHDGYACCYNPREDDIILAISAWRSNSETDADIFAKELTKSFLEMQAVCEEPKKSKL